MLINNSVTTTRVLSCTLGVNGVHAVSPAVKVKPLDNDSAASLVCVTNKPMKLEIVTTAVAFHNGPSGASVLNLVVMEEPAVIDTAWTWSYRATEPWKKIVIVTRISVRVGQSSRQ